MKIVSFGRISPFNLFLLLIPLVTTSGTMLLKTSPQYGSHIIFYVVLIYLGQVFIGIAELIKKRLSKRQRTKVNPALQNLMQKVVIRKDNPHLIKNYLIIALITTIDFIRVLGMYILMSFESIKVLIYELRTSELIFMGILSTLFLHYPFFRHHLVSIIVIVIGMIFASLNFVDFNEDQSLIIKIVVALIAYMILAIRCVVEKWLMEIRHYSPFYLLFIEGVIGSVYSVILIFIGSNTICLEEWAFCETGKPVENMLDTFELLFTDIIFFLQMAWYFISHALNNMFLFVLNKNTSPTHRAVSDSLVYFVWATIIIIQTMAFDSTLYLICFIVGYIFIIIGSMVYNEIVILYVCGLGTNTKAEIQERAIVELNMLNISDMAELQQINN